MIADLSTGIDGRGDNAYFIEEKHFIEDWKVDDQARTHSKDAVFFRVIKNGEERSSHGRLADNEVVQWG